MSTGGILNGDQVDPVTFVIGSLHARFAPLEEESRLQCMTEMWAFARRHGEGINALLSRYEQVRARAANEGQFVMSIEGCSLQLLRAVGIRPQHLYTLLQPFEGQLPRTEQEFSKMCQELRRHGHIMESTHGNISSVLAGPLHQAQPCGWAELSIEKLPAVPFEYPHWST